MVAASNRCAHCSNEVNMAAQGPRGKVTIDVEECKGCGICVEACPPHCLELAPELSAYGVHPAHYCGERCTACGICFYCCPEPGAITVYRAAAPKKPAATKVKGGPNAPAL
jgi:2-oxoglutarate ferredoxin oxidoreductase subunit delta